MEIDKVIDSTERYLREFLYYLIAFFWPSAKVKPVDPKDDEFNRSVIFAMLSAAVGAYLWSKNFGGAANGGDLIGVLTDNLLRWISLGALLYAIMRLFGVDVEILLPVIATVKVMAVAHVVGVYAGYVVKSCVWYVLTPDKFTSWADLVGVSCAYTVQWVIVIYYLPREIDKLAPGDDRKTRRRAMDALFLSIVTLVIAVRLAGWVLQSGEYRQDLIRYCHALKTSGAIVPADNPGAVTCRGIQ